MRFKTARRAQDREHPHRATEPDTVLLGDDSKRGPSQSAVLPDSSVQDRSLLTIREAAALLRVSQSTVRNAIRAGQLRAFRFGIRGGGIRIGLADLDGGEKGDSHQIWWV